MAYDKCFIDIDSDSLIHIARTYYEKHGSRLRYGESLYYQGIVQMNAGDYQSAIVSLERALEIAKAVGTPKFQGLIYMAMRAVYSLCYLNSECVRCDTLGIACFEKAEDSLQIYRAKSMLASDWMNQGHLLQARKLFQQLLEDAPQDIHVLENVLPAYADSYIIQKEAAPDSAMALYSQFFALPPQSLSQRQWCRYADALYQAGYQKEALSLLQMLQDDSDQPTGDLLQLQYLFSRYGGNYRDAIDKLEDLVEMQNDVVRKQIEQSILKEQRNYAEQQRKQAELESRNRLLINILLILILGILSSGAALLIRSMRRKNAARISQLEQVMGESSRLLRVLEDEKERLADDLNQARNQYVAAYKGQITQVAKLVETYRHSNGLHNSRDIVYQHVTDIACTIADDQATFKALERKVNAHLNQAMRLYREAFPLMPESHYHLVCYIMAGFPASTIQLLLGISPSNVYTQKSRIRDSIEACDFPEKDILLRAII